MKKLAAFGAAFLLALTVALVPLAVSDLGRPGAQPAVEAQHAGPLPSDIDDESPEYEYLVWPGIQEEVTDVYLYLRWKDGQGNDHAVEDDDGGDWNNSRIYEPLGGGRRHTIEATTSAPGKTGSFEITLCRFFYEQHDERVLQRTHCRSGNRRMHYGFGYDRRERPYQGRMGRALPF